MKNNRKIKDVMTGMREGTGRRNSRPYSAEGHRLYLDQSNESKQYGDLVFGFHLGNRRLWRCTQRRNCYNIQTSNPSVQLPFSEQCWRKSKRRRLPIADPTCNNGFQSLSSPNNDLD